MTREQDIPVLKAEAILQKFQEIILETESNISTRLDIKGLVVAVNK